MGNVCQIVSGSTPKTTIPEYWDGEIKWITPAEIAEDTYIINDSIRKITELGVQKTGLIAFPKGTVILSSRAPIGKVAIAGCEMYCNQGFKNLICSSKLNNRYLYWFLKGKKDFLNTLGRGATFKEISKQIVSNIEIELPSMDMQEQIADKFDKLQSIITHLRTQLEKLDLLVKARFVEMFGSIHESNNYPYILVKELTTVISGGTPNREKPLYWNNGTIPWIKTTELKNNIITSSEECITQTGLNESSAKLVPPKTILIAMYGQGKTRGMTAYLNIEASTNQACACILPSNKINSLFLWKYFQLSYDKLRNMAKGGNQPNLNGNIIKNFPVLLPPLNEQEEYVKFVKQVDKSKVAVRKELDKAQILFDSLMQEYFG